MYKTLDKIKKHIKSTFVSNTKKSADVNTILVIHESLNDHNIYIQAINKLVEDFDITIRNSAAEKNAIFKNSDRFDFVLILSSFKGAIHQKFKTLKKRNSISGMVILDKELPQNHSDTSCYDVLWFPAYAYGKQLPSTVFKIHGYAFDEKLEVDEASSVEDQILYNRFHDISLSAFEAHNHEFLKSPIWNLRYLSFQLQKGFNAFEKEKIKSTNLIMSNVKLMAGRFSFYNANLLVTGDEYVSIGSFCSFGKNISIYTSNHDTNYASTQGYIYRKFFKTNHPGENKINPSKSRTKGPVIIKNDVWIGDGVKIMTGVTIGNGACIAAGSIVTANVGDYEIVGGIPAKVIKMRFKSQRVIDQLLKLEWWHWSDKKITLNSAFFTQNFNEIEDLDNIEIK